MRIVTQKNKIKQNVLRDPKTCVSQYTEYNPTWTILNDKGEKYMSIFFNIKNPSLWSIPMTKTHVLEYTNDVQTYWKS